MELFDKTKLGVLARICKQCHYHTLIINPCEQGCNQVDYALLDKIKPMSVTIAAILAIILICSCSDNQNNTLEFNKTQQVDVECTQIPYSDILGISMQLLKKDSLLLINDFHGDSLIHVLDVKHNIVHKKLVSKGIGPNEFISPLAISMTDSTMYIYERQTFRLFSFPVEMILSSDKSVKLKFTANTQNTNSMPLIVFPLSDSMFVASGIHADETRFSVHNNKGEVMSGFGKYPAYWHEEIDFPNKARSMYHQTYFEKHPSRKLFVAYSGHILGIYQYESIHQAPTLIRELLLSKYRYNYINNETTVTADRAEGVERGIVSVSCSSKYIF